MDDAEARAILREHGKEPPARGKLGDHWHAEAESLRQDGPPPGDYDAGVTEADFPGPELDGEVIAPPPPERRPRRPVKAKTSWRQKLSGARAKPAAKAAKKKHPRVSLVDLISDVWAGLAGAATRVDPPLGRCLMVQSGVAGLLLEDVVKGTAVDAALQPLARAEDKAKKAAALLMPPAIVLALERAQALPETRRKGQEAILLPMLHQSLVMLVRVTGDKADQLAERAVTDGPVQAEADRLMAIILGITPPGEVADGVAAAQQMAGV